MYKKVSIVILLLMLSIYFIQPIRAEETQENEVVTVSDTDAYFDWYIEENQGVHMLKSNRIHNTSTFIDITVYTFKDLAYNENSPEEEEIFVYENGNETSRLTTYQSETSISAIKNYAIDYPDPFTDFLMFLEYESQESYGAELGDVYFDITLVLSDELSSDERDFVLAVANNDTTELARIINENNLNVGINDLDFTFLELSMTQVSNEVDPNDLSDLPMTEGNIFDDVNLMADVEIMSINDYQVNFRITYNLQPYDLSYTFSENTDMSIFNNQYEIFYYTDVDDHFMVLNQGETSMFYSTGATTETFIPYTTWNMDTNELATIDRFNVYLYMKVGDGEHLNGYFYVDEFVIDNLISVNTSFKYRFENIFGADSWNIYNTVLEDGTYTEGNISWKLKGAVYSSVAVSIASMIPGLEVPALIIGTPLSLYLQYQTYQELIDGNNLWIADTEEIQAVDPNELLEDEINAAYLDAYADFEGLNLSTYNLYQLDFGTFEKPFYELKIDEDSINVISFTYMTHGQVYTIDEENINTIGVIEDDLEPSEDNQENLWNMIKTFLLDLYADNPSVFLLIGIVLMIIVIGTVVTVLNTVKKPIKAFFTPLGIFLAVVATIVLLVMFGT
jgi:hypothetical protein